jgi:hypothetical protein
MCTRPTTAWRIHENKKFIEKKMRCQTYFAETQRVRSTFSQAWSHVLGLPNGGNVTDVGRNGIEGKKVYVDGTQV